MSTEEETNPEPKRTKSLKNVWKNVVVDRNPDTGKVYYERRKVAVSELDEIPLEPETPPAREPVIKPLSKKDRGNYTADIVHDLLEKAEDRRDEIEKQQQVLSEASKNNIRK